ncbi:nitrogen fixation protein NifZ [Rhizomicrobium palustre]|uniref:Nitrogen fixation protein NifZ n=1 Tax=Rhizomicrobium palustre TaxID=189966 RepID=A0A846N1U1_9PROT|nr:nitrogen fixation protein NifZ [Rhizomicrobium palustre]NIK89182.1 nitrogen fixation protein NifZ [Rhizomicrobium palustre]
MADDIVELAFPPEFALGDKVRAKALVRNDGSFLGKRIGDLLIEKGEIGYVRGVGTFLQRYFIYEIDFLERCVVVGMRAKELELVEAFEG